MVLRKERGQLEPTSASNSSREKSAFKLNAKALAIHTTSLQYVQNGPCYLLEIPLPRLKTVTVNLWGQTGGTNLSKRSEGRGPDDNIKVQLLKQKK